MESLRSVRDAVNSERELRQLVAAKPGPHCMNRVAVTGTWNRLRSGQFGARGVGAVMHAEIGIAPLPDAGNPAYRFSRRRR